MALTTAQKLKVKEGNTILIINAPSEYKIFFESLTEGVKITDSSKSFNHVHWFVKDRAQMEKDLKKVLPLIKDDVIAWIFFPKGKSKIQTDLNRDSVWAVFQNQNVQMITLISFDDTWSAFGIRQKTKTDKKKAYKPKESALLSYVDSKTKTVKLPDDVATILKNKKILFDHFNSLAFTHKKEYVEWIVSAKKEETRKQRIKQMIEMLEKKWKNPSNR